MKKSFVLAVSAFLLIAPSSAAAEQAVASFNLPIRALATSGPRALAAGAKLSEKQAKQHCKNLGRELHLKLSPNIGSIDSFVMQTFADGRVLYVVEGVVAGACVLK